MPVGAARRGRRRRARPRADRARVVGEVANLDLRRAARAPVDDLARPERRDEALQVHRTPSLPATRAGPSRSRRAGPPRRPRENASAAALERSGGLPSTTQTGSALRRSRKITSRQTPWWRPSRSRLPTTRNPTRRVQGEAGVVLREDAGLDRPDPRRLGAPDQLLHQFPAHPLSAPPPRRRRPSSRRRRRRRSAPRRVRARPSPPPRLRRARPAAARAGARHPSDSQPGHLGLEGRVSGRDPFGVDPPQPPPSVRGSIGTISIAATIPRPLAGREGACGLSVFGASGGTSRYCRSNLAIAANAGAATTPPKIEPRGSSTLTSTTSRGCEAGTIPTNEAV